MALKTLSASKKKVQHGGYKFLEECTSYQATHGVCLDVVMGVLAEYQRRTMDSGCPPIQLLLPFLFSHF